MVLLSTKFMIAVPSNYKNLNSVTIDVKRHSLIKNDLKKFFKSSVNTNRAEHFKTFFLLNISFCESVCEGKTL
jgi:hypothetical protein